MIINDLVIPRDIVEKIFSSRSQLSAVSIKAAIYLLDKVGTSGKFPIKKSMSRYLCVNSSSLYKSLTQLITQNIITFEQTGRQTLHGNFKFNYEPDIRSMDEYINKYIETHTIDEIMSNSNIPKEKLIEYIKNKEE